MDRKEFFRKRSVWAPLLALILAWVVAFSPFAVPKLFAALAVDTEKECSLTFHLDNVEAEYRELADVEIPVEVYQVAGMDTEGNYLPNTAFGSLKLPRPGEEANAEKWQELAEGAAKIVEDGGIKPAAEIVLNAPEGIDEISGLSVGMYLVFAQTVQTAEYNYAFTPYLISLPNNYYYETQDDAWVYDVQSDLKPDQTVRYGNIEITKELLSYNQSLGGAYFVFQVEAEKNGQTVYSDAFAMDFQEAGSQSLAVEHIPAGATVTVTEVYSGASYTPEAGSQQATVIADGEAGSPAGVTFRNDYDGRGNSGIGIVNHFTYTDGTWDVEQQ